MFLSHLLIDISSPLVRLSLTAVLLSLLLLY